MWDDERHRRTGGIHLIILVIGRIEPLVIHTIENGGLPRPSQLENPALRQTSLERALQLEEVVVAPHRLDADERRRVLEPGALLPIPRKAVEEPALDDVHAIHESAERLEVRADPREPAVI